MLVISYYSSIFLHAETYVWQSTVLTNYIRPVNRLSCLPSLSFPRPDLPKLNIAITYLYDNNDASWDESLMSAIIENRKRYCQKHGYTLINGNEYEYSSARFYSDHQGTKSVHPRGSTRLHHDRGLERTQHRGVDRQEHLLVHLLVLQRRDEGRSTVCQSREVPGRYSQSI